MPLLKRLFRLDAIPADSDEHLHSCPMPDCSHEFVIRRKEGSSPGPVMTVAFRDLRTEEGIRRRAVKVKLPGACWCGAPLPGEEEVTFDAIDVVKNIERAEKELSSIRGSQGSPTEGSS